MQLYIKVNTHTANEKQGKGEIDSPLQVMSKWAHAYSVLQQLKKLFLECKCTITVPPEEGKGHQATKPMEFEEKI